MIHHRIVMLVLVLMSMLNRMVLLMLLLEEMIHCSRWITQMNTPAWPGISILFPFNLLISIVLRTDGPFNCNGLPATLA